MNETATHASSPAQIAFAWLFVGLPLLWGISQTVMKSMPLFH